MATMTINAASVAVGTSQAAETKPSFFGRFMEALIESRQRKAEIEARRVLAMISEPRDRLDYAMLPFAGE